MKKIKLKIKGMSCESCAVTIESYLKREKGVQEVQINYGESAGYVAFDPGKTSAEKILKNRIFTRYQAEELT